MSLIPESRRVSAEKDGKHYRALKAIAVDVSERISLEFDEDGQAEFVIEWPPPKSYATHCGVPMIPTNAFYQAELYCMECGAKLGMFSPWAMSDPATPELHEAYRKVAAEWDENVGPYIIPDGHEGGRSEADREANAKARSWLERRWADVHES